MEGERGLVQLIASKTYSWTIGQKYTDRVWISKLFVHEGHSIFFCIAVKPNNNISGNFNLYQVIGNVQKTFDFIVTLKYKFREKILVKENIKPQKVKNLFNYSIADIETNELQRIVCTLIKKEISSEEISEKDQKELDENQGESSHKRKQEEGNISVGQSKRKKTVGLEALSRNLKEAFLSEEDSDVTINVGDKIYAAHKVILRNRSSVFQKMFQHDMTKKNQRSVDICDCDPHVFRDFLLYLYTGKIDGMTKDSVFKLYYMSNKYDVKELKIDCVEFILNNLGVDIICDVITLATSHKEHELLKQAISFFTLNAKDIFLTTKWQVFIKEYPIQANELVIKSFNKISEK